MNGFFKLLVFAVAVIAIGKYFGLSWPNADRRSEAPLSRLEYYDIEPYASSSNHEAMVKSKVAKMGTMTSVEDVQAYIDANARGPYKCHVTGEMVWECSQKYDVDVEPMLALMHVDSHFGTAANKDGSPSKAVRTKNPGNVGNDDNNRLRPFPSWKAGVEAVAKWLDRHRKVTATQN